LWSWWRNHRQGKIEGLLAAEARVRVVAPQVTPAIAQWLAQENGVASKDVYFCGSRRRVSRHRGYLCAGR